MASPIIAVKRMMRESLTLYALGLVSSAVVLGAQIWATILLPNAAAHEAGVLFLAVNIVAPIIVIGAIEKRFSQGVLDYISSYEMRASGGIRRSSGYIDGKSLNPAARSLRDTICSARNEEQVRVAVGRNLPIYWALLRQIQTLEA